VAKAAKQALALEDANLSVLTDKGYHSAKGMNECEGVGLR